MRRLLGLILLAGLTLSAGAQHLLSLDSCRALALRNNKQLSVSRVKQDVAMNLRKSARTKYLPRVTAYGAYEHLSKEVSILNNDQKTTLSNLGTSLVGGIQSGVTGFLSGLPAGMWSKLGGLGITPESLSAKLSSDLSPVETALNQKGQDIVDAFRTDNRDMFMGGIMVTQPVFMGGAITALNRMADIGEQMAANSAETSRQLTIYTIDQAYWQVVSLKHKQRLAESFLQLVRKLDGDVQKMIAEGVATRSEGLSVSVKVNEAEMTLAKVNDGLSLSKMNLAQICGLPITDQITLVDENAEDLSGIPETSAVSGWSMEAVAANRPELKLLQNTVDLGKQATNLMKAANLPQVLLMGGYAVSNPNVYNGFEKKWAGIWNVGLVVRIPVWNWGDGAYKVRAAKGATAIASLELAEAKEKIELQVNQSVFHVNEAHKRMQLAKASTERADENLRTANLGFREGVISSTTVMEAQTAWLQAQSQMIDAEIDVKLSEVNLQKALGVLAP